jgi:hypothetical protein
VPIFTGLHNMKRQTSGQSRRLRGIDDSLLIDRPAALNVTRLQAAGSYSDPDYSSLTLKIRNHPALMTPPTVRKQREMR